MITVDGLDKDRIEDKVVQELVQSVSKREILRAVAHKKYTEVLNDLGRDELRKTFNRITGQKLG